MSFYNLLFGMNPDTDVILAIIGLKRSDIERFRDCGMDERGVWVLTRTGGRNRSDYQNLKLVQNPYFLRTEDEEFDNTYAYYYFRYPEEVEDDCIKFLNFKENGISGKLVKWILKTLEREETEEDRKYRIWETQNSLVQQSKRTFIAETNGWIIVPLDDSSLEKYLKLMEEAGGCQLSYSVRPYKIKIQENVPRWKFEEDKEDREMCRVKIDVIWEVDWNLWKHWKKKYEDKYPKAIATIEKEVNDERDKI